MNDNLNKIKMEQNYMNNDIDEIRKRNLILVRDNYNLAKDNEKLRIKINNNNINIKEDKEKLKNHNSCWSQVGSKQVGTSPLDQQNQSIVPFIPGCATKFT